MFIIMMKTEWLMTPIKYCNCFASFCRILSLLKKTVKKRNFILFFVLIIASMCGRVNICDLNLNAGWGNNGSKF